jgi:hypothetical protein
MSGLSAAAAGLPRRHLIDFALPILAPLGRGKGSRRLWLDTSFVIEVF